MSIYRGIAMIRRYGLSLVFNMKEFSSKLKRYKMSIHCFEEALLLDNNNHFLYQKLSELYMDLNDEKSLKNA